jgi:hypothetical protein
VRYYLIADDGQKYGPADIATLNQWAAESRLRPDHQLEAETTAQRVQASTVQGIYFPTPGAAPYQGYYPRPGDAVYDDGSSELKNAWIFSILSIVCSLGCLSYIFAPFGIVYANRAKAKGNQNTTGPIIVASLGLVIAVVVTIFRIIAIARYQR